MMNSEIVSIASLLKTKYFNETNNAISIFLCGGAGKEEAELRAKVGKEITKRSSKYIYTVHYPEDMFVELLLSRRKHSLLGLENLLADSVNAVAILLQSDGTFAEIGAFSNYEKLKDKLIVVNDPKYKRSKSFINLGPIRTLTNETKSRVLWIPLKIENLKELVNQIVDGAREISKFSKPKRELSNPIIAYRFYLAIIYVFEPITKANVLNIASVLSNGDALALISAEAVINGLINERKIYQNGEGYCTTMKGSDALISKEETKTRAKTDKSFLSDLRIKSLNLILRKNKRRLWGEIGKA